MTSAFIVSTSELFLSWLKRKLSPDTTLDLEWLFSSENFVQKHHNWSTRFTMYSILLCYWILLEERFICYMFLPLAKEVQAACLRSIGATYYYVYAIIKAPITSLASTFWYITVLWPPSWCWTRSFLEAKFAYKPKTYLWLRIPEIWHLWEYYTSSQDLLPSGGHWFVSKLYFTDLVVNYIFCK